MNSPIDLIVTGIPRSGTTLVCALVDSLDNAVCLSEPPWQDDWPRQTIDRKAYARRLREDFAQVRARLCAGESVPDRRSGDGRAVCDYYPRGDGPTPVIMPFARAGLDADFLLGMKHNAHYSCALEELADCGNFRIVAVIRHPLAVIASWRAMDLPISSGRLPAGEGLWPEMSAAIASTGDILLRQVRVYELFCARYRALSDHITLMRYEHLVHEPTMLCRLLDRPQVREAPVCVPSRTARSDAETETIKEQLRKHAPHACALYPDICAA